MCDQETLAAANRAMGWEPVPDGCPDAIRTRILEYRKRALDAYEKRCRAGVCILTAKAPGTKRQDGFGEPPKDDGNGNGGNGNGECLCDCPACQAENCLGCSNPDCQDPNCEANARAAMVARLKHAGIGSFAWAS